MTGHVHRGDPGGRVSETFISRMSDHSFDRKI